MRAALRLAAALAATACASPPGLAAAAEARRFELVSPSTKLGNDVIAETSRTRAAAQETDGLPMAVTFASLGGFADVQGTGISTEYLAQRTGAPGTSGWSTHAITPPQEPLTLSAAALSLDPLYEGDMAADLTKAVFRAWSPLTDAPNVADVENLYAREDLRVPGVGAYRLLTGAFQPLAPIVDGAQQPFLAAASDDLEHVLFESRLALTSDATPGNVMLYKADGGVVRRVSAGSSTCPSSPALLRGFPLAPCEAAGTGVSALRQTRRTLSADGSRVTFTSPVGLGGGVSTSAGVVSGLHQLDDRGTPTLADDAVVQLNASEQGSPGVAQAAIFQTASSDGSRVVFTSQEQLTDEPLTRPTGLYLWQRRATDETQAVDVDAAGGSFTLTFHTRPAAGAGTLTAGSATVTDVAGSFTIGQAIAGPGIPAGTTVAGLDSFLSPATSTLTLSAPATADGPAPLAASVEQTTAPLPHDASAAQVRAALEALGGIGAGNVAVAGGAGAYEIAFTGALAGVNVAQLTADGGGLAGPGAAVHVATTHPLGNLRLLASAGVVDVIGASEDGRRVYFVATGQLVPGGPVVAEGGIYLWDEGTLSFVGGISLGDRNGNVNAHLWNQNPVVSRVTPDGRHLLFTVSDGSELAPRYDHGSCASNPNVVGNGACSQLYLYGADGSTPLAPDLVCVSCNPSGAPATANARINVHVGSGASQVTTHLSRPLADDGSRVFFSTAEALVPQDGNGRVDVYEYDAPSASVRLVSTGRGSSDAWFMDASRDGRDVFFVTREQLVGWDVDQANDLYDARAGGGFPEPPPPSAGCAGDGCRGPGQAAPAAPRVGTATFSGQGNRRAPARPARRRRARACRRGFMRKRVAGRRRCVRRAARARRRGSR